MTQIVEQGRQFCRENNLGWPKAFVVWEEVKDTKGAKEPIKTFSKPDNKTK